MNNDLETPDDVRDDSLDDDLDDAVVAADDTGMVAQERYITEAEIEEGLEGDE